VALGNHDYYTKYVGPVGYERYFGVQHFAGKSYYGGHRADNNANSYMLFSAGGMDFIAVSLQYGTEPAVLDWANQVLAAYPDRRAMIVSHSIVGPRTNGVLFNAQGQPIYDALKANTNIFMMLCGHEPETGRREDTYLGNTIHSLLADYENQVNGGGGFLKIMRFFPSSNTISVKAYSPVSGFTFTGSWHTFNLRYNMSLPITEAGKAYASGTPARVRSLPLQSLRTNTWYEWFVRVNQGTQVYTSPVFTFLNSAPSEANIPFEVRHVTADGEGHVSIGWPSIGGARYRVEFSDEPANDREPRMWREVLRPPEEEVDPAPAGEPSEQVFLDDFSHTGGPPTQGFRFFRIRKIE